MATQSFYEDLVLRTPEAVKNLERAIDEAEKRGRLKLDAKGPETDPKILEAVIKHINSLKVE